MLQRSFWASCRFSDDALQIAFSVDRRANGWDEEEPGKRRVGMQGPGPEALLGIIVGTLETACRRDDGNDASGDTRHTLLGLENGPP